MTSGSGPVGPTRDDRENLMHGTGPAKPPTFASPAYETALELLDGFGPEYDSGLLSGLSNHGPMVADALCALGRDTEVERWVLRYRRQLAPMPSPVGLITTVDWHRHLGDLGRVADWVSFFERQLAWVRWDAVLAEWGPILAPGLAGAAGHGLLRTAHAIRGAADDPTYLQRRELAQGLGYWAATYQPLPGGPAALAGTSDDPVSILTGLELLRPEQRSGGLITDRFDALAEHRGIANATTLLDTTAEPAAVLGRIVEAAAVTLAVNASPESVIALLHGVTATVALRSLLPYVPTWSIAPILTHSWQFVAALHIMYAESPALDVSLPSASVSLSTLVDRAISSGDEHAIKLAEATVRMRTKGFAKSLDVALERCLPLLGADGTPGH